MEIIFIQNVLVLFNINLKKLIRINHNSKKLKIYN
jgi:hypothetical protein